MCKKIVVTGWLVYILLVSYIIGKLLGLLLLHFIDYDLSWLITGVFFVDGLITMAMCTAASRGD